MAEAIQQTVHTPGSADHWTEGYQNGTNHHELGQEHEINHQDHHELGVQQHAGFEDHHAKEVHEHEAYQAVSETHEEAEHNVRHATEEAPAPANAHTEPNLQQNSVHINLNGIQLIHKPQQGPLPPPFAHQRIGSFQNFGLNNISATPRVYSGNTPALGTNQVTAFPSRLPAFPSQLNTSYSVPYASKPILQPQTTILQPQTLRQSFQPSRPTLQSYLGYPQVVQGSPTRIIGGNIGGVAPFQAQLAATRGSPLGIRSNSVFPAQALNRAPFGATAGIAPPGYVRNRLF
eukprot:TRINITY_DN3874_c0_g4_i2.p1 TRINITY_DN3874_c0_g4~~TRINITY_DN3874_c0_g4_i2.p1  ORF type:complete len:289 (-),score=53.69 TRINITY_DN3874_c0_g4_i2:79-945(-)